MNWVCAGTFDNRELVSASTITEQEEEMMGKELDYEICIPCVVHWCMLVFSAPTRLNQTLERDLKTRSTTMSGTKRLQKRSPDRSGFSHSTNVHVGSGGHGLAHNTQEVGSE